MRRNFIAGRAKSPTGRKISQVIKFFLGQRDFDLPALPERLRPRHPKHPHILPYIGLYRLAPGVESGNAAARSESTLKGLGRLNEKGPGRAVTPPEPSFRQLPGRHRTEVGDYVLPFAVPAPQVRPDENAF